MRRWPTGNPEISNTDQGSQFTGFDFTGVLKNAGVRISMDGRGRCQFIQKGSISQRCAVVAKLETVLRQADLMNAF